MRVPLCPAVHGHIADSVRDHEPGPGGRIALDEEAEGAVHRTACCWISMARQPQKITGGPAVWPAHSPRAVARTLLVPGYRRDGGGTVQNATTARAAACQAVRSLPLHAGSGSRCTARRYSNDPAPSPAANR